MVKSNLSPSASLSSSSPFPVRHPWPVTFNEDIFGWFPWLPRGGKKILASPSGSLFHTHTHFFFLSADFLEGVYSSLKLKLLDVRRLRVVMEQYELKPMIHNHKELLTTLVILQIFFFLFFFFLALACGIFAVMDREAYKQACLLMSR